MSTPTTDDLEVVQDLIRFCPLCGYESTKEFNDFEAVGGDWICENCGEPVEAYIIEGEEEDDDDDSDQTSNSSLLFWLVLVVLLGVYFFI